MMKRRHLLAAPAIAVLAAPPAGAADKMDPQLLRRARRAVAGGLHYLRGQQAADGSLLKSVGITALALRAFLESPEAYNESDGAFVAESSIGTSLTDADGWRLFFQQLSRSVRTEGKPAFAAARFLGK